MHFCPIRRPFQYVQNNVTISQNIRFQKSYKVSSNQIESNKLYYQLRAIIPACFRVRKFVIDIFCHIVKNYCLIWRINCFCEFSVIVYCDIYYNEWSLFQSNTKIKTGTNHSLHTYLDFITCLIIA